MGHHAELVGPQGNHVAHDFEYADTAAREAATGLVAGDLKKLALQLDNNTLWILTATTPTWVTVTGSGSGGDTLASILGAGNNTGGNDIVVDTGDKITLVDAPVLATDAVNKNYVDLRVFAEGSLAGSALVTTIPAVDALVIINTTTWVEDQAELMTVKSSGAVSNDSTKNELLACDASIRVDPATATKIIEVQYAGVHIPLRTVTFTNSTNVVDEVATPRVDGDIITFFENAGTLPTGLRDDILYYVVGKTANTFQLSYTLGGAAVTFSDDGSGTNTYCVAGLHGSMPTRPVSSGTPADIDPKALIEVEPNDSVIIVISNKTDAVNITVSNGYNRLIGGL